MIVTGTTAVSPSVTVAGPTVTIGVLSTSSIVTSPDTSVVLVFPLVTSPFTVNVSFGSSVPSVVVGISTFTVVSPAGIVAVTVVSV